MRFRRDLGMPRSSWVAGATGTVLVHGAFAALLVFSAQGSKRPPQLIYSVELVAAPRPVPRARTAPAPAPSPPAAPTVAPDPTPPKKAVPIKKPDPPPKVDPKTEPAKPTRTPNEPVPDATPSTGTDVDNVKVTGATFPYPEYLRNLTNEILRRWRRPAGTANLQTEVSFTIMRDGSVRDILVIQGSRNYTFDLEAQGAVEQAAEDRAFGPLPKGWTPDILQVAFLFTPRKQR